jgi:hypothetical protein
MNVSDMFIISADELGSADAVISLPCDLLGATTDSVQLNSLSAWWDIDDSPICSSTIPSLAWIGSLQGFAIVVVGFNLELGIGRGRSSITTSGRAVGGRAGSHLKATAATATINLNVKLLELGGTPAFPGFSPVDFDLDALVARRRRGRRWRWGRCW